VILFNQGDCQTRSPRITDWDAAWIPLGAAPDHDLCRLGQPGPATAAELDKFGVMGLVYPLIAQSVQQCAGRARFGVSSTTTDSDHMQTLDCLRSTGPEATLSVPPALFSMSSADADQRIANFLSRSSH
ncbi:MAG: hypothetical protein ACREQC_11360, partial [Candidatus Binataceae bacterium]